MRRAPPVARRCRIVSPQRGGRRGPAPALRPRADLDRVSDGRARHGAAGRPAPSSPFDAQAAMEHLLARLRASTGATRVSVWVHEASTEMVVPFHRVVSPTGEPAPDHPRL